MNTYKFATEAQARRAARKAAAATLCDFAVTGHPGRWTVRRATASEVILHARKPWIDIVYAPEPRRCRKCGARLQASRGYVGETVLYCEQHGIMWEDSQEALRRVL